MPNHKMSSAFITCSLPTDMPRAFDRHYFFTLVSRGLAELAPTLRVLSVLETGQNADNLHLHYAVEWYENHSIYFRKINDHLKIVYKEHTTFTLVKSTFTIVKLDDFYLVAGGYLAKESTREVLQSKGLDETSLAQGALRYEKQQRASEKKRSNQTKTEAFYSSFGPWSDKTYHGSKPSSLDSLVERLYSYMVYAEEEGCPQFPLATQFASRGIVLTLAARMGVPNHHGEFMLSHMLDLRG